MTIPFTATILNDMKKGNEFRVTGDGEGEPKDSADSAIHERILKNPRATIRADIAAVNAGLSLGLSMAESLAMFAGDGAFRFVAGQGFATS